MINRPHGGYFVLTPEGTLVPDSAYGVQLREGFGRLRFAAALEHEFAQEYAAQHLLRMRVGFLVAIVLYALFLFLRLRVEAGPSAGWGLALRSAIIMVLSLTLLLSYTPALRGRMGLPLVLCYFAFGAGVTGIEIVGNYYGVDRHYEGLILVSIHCYVFSGLMLRHAVASGLLITSSYVVGGLLGGMAGKVWGYQVFFILVTNLIASAALYSTEYVERENFLRRHLLREMASRDGLTGIHNRSAFMVHFERLLRQARREGRVLGLMMLDIDWFKPYNDRYGHVDGDACLQRVAETIRASFRRGLDLSARYGGEEFIGVWYDLDPRALIAAASAVRDAVANLGIPHEASAFGRVTVSVGAISFVPGPEDSLLDLIRQADTALYAAKAQGRDCVVTQVLPSAATGPEAIRA